MTHAEGKGFRPLNGTPGAVTTAMEAVAVGKHLGVSASASRERHQDVYVSTVIGAVIALVGVMLAGILQDRRDRAQRSAAREDATAARLYADRRDAHLDLLAELERLTIPEKLEDLVERAAVLGDDAEILNDLLYIRLVRVRVFGTTASADAALAAVGAVAGHVQRNKRETFAAMGHALEEYRLAVRRDLGIDAP